MLIPATDPATVYLIVMTATGLYCLGRTLLILGKPDTAVCASCRHHLDTWPTAHPQRFTLVLVYSGVWALIWPAYLLLYARRWALTRTGIQHACGHRSHPE